MTKSHRRPGAGSVRKLPSGRWQARRTEADGTVRGLGTWPTRAEADRALAAAELEDLTGERRLDDTGTVGEWTERWLASGHGWKPSTRAGYVSATRSHVLPRWGDVPLGAVTRADVQRWVDDLVLAAARPDVIRRALAPLRGAYRLAVDHEATRTDPTAGVHTPTPPKRDLTMLSIVDIEALATAIQGPAVDGNHGRERPDLALVVRLAAYGGLRAGEIWGLKLEAVDLEVPALHVIRSVTEAAGRVVVGPPKTGRGRRVVLPASLRTLLADQAERARSAGVDWLFASSAGTPIRHRLFSARQFRPACRMIGRPDLRFHDLRHTHVGLLIAQGWHPRAISERVGHSTVRLTLDRYGHLFPSLDEQMIPSLDEAILASGTFGTSLARQPDPQGASSRRYPI